MFIIKINASNTDVKAVTFDLAASTIRILTVRNCVELMNVTHHRLYYFLMMESRRSYLGMWSLFYNTALSLFLPSSLKNNSDEK